MKQVTLLATPQPVSNLLPLAAVIAGLFAASANAMEVEGFTEPYRTIHVAADEMGIVQEILVREGRHVESGQALARLNSDVQRSLLAIAAHNMQAEGRLEAARADLQLKQQRLAILEPLCAEGCARQEEVDRARADLAIAQSNVQVAEEDLLTRKLEYDKIRVQLERRTIRAPIAGVITSLEKQPGEFIAPNSPEIATLVELDRLLANFTVMGPQAERLQVGQKLDVLFVASRRKAVGVVEFVSPVADAESGTIQVKLCIDNPELQWRSGERCKIKLPN